MALHVTRLQPGPPLAWCSGVSLGLVPRCARCCCHSRDDPAWTLRVAAFAAEEAGAAEAIATNLTAMASLRTPIVTIILGEKKMSVLQHIARNVH